MHERFTTKCVCVKFVINDSLCLEVTVLVKYRLIVKEHLLDTNEGF